jgi:hypothetical protein
LIDSPAHWYYDAMLSSGATDPAGLYLCIAAPGSLQPDILQRLEKW